MKKSVLIGIIVAVVVLVAVVGIVVALNTDSDKDTISIIGDIEETVEVNTVYTDKGVVYSDDLTLIIHNTVDTSKLGRQQIKYSVYSSKGDLIKDLYRFVTVVDTSAPTYTPNNSFDYYVGINYDIYDFVSTYSDNYDSKYSITVSPKSFSFDESGYQNINISFTDSSNNTSTYTCSIYVKLDFEKIINEKYKYQSIKVSSGITGIGSKYTSVQIDSDTSFC
jgi:hypothetical protein